MEIDEYLTVPDGKGDIHFKLTRPTKDNYLELETAFSFDSAYDNHTAEELGKACKEHPITRMAAAIARGHGEPGKKFWKTLSGQILPLKKG